MARCGKFAGVKNYIALVGKKNENLNETIGYFGERVVLKAQQLGLNTCWVSSTFSRDKCAAKVTKDEKLVCVIALGYGTTQGVPHKNKPLGSLCKTDGETPEWFNKGMEAVVLAPTALNRQDFFFTFVDGVVRVKIKGGAYSKIDLGIIKYHFETGAGKNNFTWQIT